jgi:ADP-L-glycero-D-manno-heptose 6-epimerase
VIIVTGGAGFIGSNLVAQLSDAGEKVVVSDWLGCDQKWKNIGKRNLFDFVFPEDLPNFLERVSGDVAAVVHMGAISSTTAVDGDEILRRNIGASKALWTFCSEKQKPLIYASSAATYGDGEVGFDDSEFPNELARLRPLNLYGWSKHAFDRWAVARAGEGFAPPQWVGLKFFNVYGPNEYHKGDMQSIVAKMFAPLKAGETVRLFRSHRDGIKDGEQLRDFVYVKDCVAVMRWLLVNPGISGLFNLGTGKARSFKDLVESIGLALRKPATIDYIDMPLSMRDRYQYYTQASMNKLRAAGYTEAFHSLEAGVADYVCSYLDTGDAFV